MMPREAGKYRRKMRWQQHFRRLVQVETIFSGMGNFGNFWAVVRPCVDSAIQSMRIVNELKRRCRQPAWALRRLHIRCSKTDVGAAQKSAAARNAFGFKLIGGGESSKSFLTGRICQTRSATQRLTRRAAPSLVRPVRQVNLKRRREE
jgi:hypothetical protein